MKFYETIQSSPESQIASLQAALAKAVGVIEISDHYAAIHINDSENGVSIKCCWTEPEHDAGCWKPDADAALTLARPLLPPAVEGQPK